MSTRKTAPLFALAAALLLVPLAAQEPQRFRTGTETVPLYVTVTDRERRLVPDLVMDDFEIYDNGQLQTITSFDNTPLPITVIVMLDTSGSMTLALDFVKEGAEQFVIRMLPEDVAMVGAFNDKIQFIPRDEFTSDRDFLIRSLKDLDFGYPTRLYDAVDESIDKLHGVEGRKVVLVFTDGDDTASRGANARGMQEKARAEDVMIYAIGLENRYFNGQRTVLSRPDRGLRGLAEETGGGYFLLKRTDELNSTFTRVAQELRSQYVLGFTPQVRDGKVHKLDVRVKRPGATARARKSYVAPTGS
ncbi:MAG: VWA domain-containing protein [Acidobacteria bacterium]|nr:VWA domain-containing protein [Acidobacteriota bacterium]MBA3888514.1 VWA domain-containing protein [Acidobacteriota bacterium]